MEAQLRTELARINAMHVAIVEDAKMHGVALGEIYSLKDSHGNYVMVPLILARSNCLLALSNLKKKS